jgi:hypothetical protein
MGYVSPGSGEDLALGGCTHEMLDLLLQGGSLENCFLVGEDYLRENLIYPDYILPEQQNALWQDAWHLSKAFVYSFNSSYLPQILDEYEVLEVEEEINWLVGMTSGVEKYIVMMSRSDGVLRKKVGDRLYHLSHKTAQTFSDIQIQKFQMDTQRFSESMAIWAKYGEPPAGTLYNYFLKGKRYQDKDLGIDRFSSGLIHPYMQRIGPGGYLNAEMLSFNYEWQELDGYTMKTRRLGKGWERVSIYDEMDFELYLNWLENEAVPRHKDYCKESIIGLKEEFFDPEFAERWRQGIRAGEEEWAGRVYYSKGETLDSGYFNEMFPLENSQCFDWGRKCTYHPICWGRQPIQYLIEKGDLIPREPNHLVELNKVTQNE